MNRKIKVVIDFGHLKVCNDQLTTLDGDQELINDSLRHVNDKNICHGP